MFRSMTEKHMPCKPCRQHNTTCSIPEDRRRWKPSTTSDEATRKTIGKATTDAALWRQKRETKGDILSGTEQRHNQNSSDDNANPDVNRLDLSIEQQIERLNPARTADFLFSHFTMVPGETHFLRSMMTVDMEGLGLGHGQGLEAPSNRESRLPSTEVAKQNPPSQQYLTEEALLYYTFGSAEHDSESVLQAFSIWESALGRE